MDEAAGDEIIAFHAIKIGGKTTGQRGEKDEWFREEDEGIWGWKGKVREEELGDIERNLES